MNLKNNKNFWIALIRLIYIYIYIHIFIFVFLFSYGGGGHLPNAVCLPLIFILTLNSVGSLSGLNHFLGCLETFRCTIYIFPKEKERARARERKGNQIFYIELWYTQWRFFIVLEKIYIIDFFYYCLYLGTTHILFV